MVRIRSCDRDGRGQSAVFLISLVPAAGACRDGSVEPRCGAATRRGLASARPVDGRRPLFLRGRFSRRPTVAEMTELGVCCSLIRFLFRKGGVRTCHDPLAYGPPNDQSTPLGGASSPAEASARRPHCGICKLCHPSLSITSTRRWTRARTRDRQAATLGRPSRYRHDQARLPLTSRSNGQCDIDSVVAKVARGALSARFRAVFGEDVFTESVRGSTALLLCLEVFQQSPKDFYPYSSRYDAYLRRQIKLGPGEQRGLALFDDPKKGNCASCHPSRIRHDGFPSFTDFGYAALGVPRNRAIAANEDAAFYTWAVRPGRADLTRKMNTAANFARAVLAKCRLAPCLLSQWCFFTRLDQVLQFYAERDTKPVRWYPKVPGPFRNKHAKIDIFDDLPPAYRANVNREPPFGGRPGSAPALGKHEIRDVVAFLKTLTDADLIKEATEASARSSGRP